MLSVRTMFGTIDYMTDNATGADNQQERLNPMWIVGFVDGEGCFCVSLFRNATSATGFQVFPEFVVTQGARSLRVLELIQMHFECGRIYLNSRKDNHRENLHRYCVRSRQDLENIIVPFFDRHSLMSEKKQDFELFKQVLAAMKVHKHLTKQGLADIAAIAALMNRKKQRLENPQRLHARSR